MTWGNVFVVIIHMYVDITIYILLYDDFMITNTMNLSNRKYL